ncbi:MAG: hypothetical protein AAGM67_10260, partial [Bacteroidota bacterium]
MKLPPLTLIFCLLLFYYPSFGQPQASPAPIQSVETQRAVFVGYSQSSQKGSYRPVSIQSLAQYER